MNRVRTALLSSIALLMACEPASDPTVPIESFDPAVAAAIGSSLSPGSAGAFFFLPPIAPDPGPRPAGSFDGDLAPDVVVCEWDDGCATTVAQLGTASGGGADRVRVDLEEEHYIANWHTDGSLGLDADYRILVLVSGTELGHADVALVRRGDDLKHVPDGVVGVVRGRTVPIKFRIEKGAVTVVGTDGGVVTLGAATLTVPAGAVDGPVGITAATVDDFPAPEEGAIVPGTVLDFGPDGLEFDPPATLTIRYDPATLPAGVDEVDLRLFELVDGTWVQVPGSGVDVDADLVSGPVSGFSTFGAGSFEGPQLTGFGTAAVDGVFGAAEWDAAGSHTFDMSLPDGTTVPATVYEMNDLNEMYFALRYPSSAAASLGFSVTFDDDGDGMSEVGDDDLFFEADPPLFADRHCFDAGFISCDQEDVLDGGTSEGAGAIGSAGGTTTIEMRHALDSDDDLHDVSLAPGDIIRFLVAVFADGQGGTGFTVVELSMLVQPAEPETVIEIVAGDAQEGAAGSTLATDPLVSVTDPSQGPDPTPGVAVTFEFTDPAGNVTTSSVTTDAAGQASLPWTLGAAAGTHRLAVFNAESNTVEFTALARGLITRWSAEGDFTDAIGDNHLTTQGGIDFTTGVIGSQAFAFSRGTATTSTGGWAYALPTPDIGTMDRFTLATWVRLDPTGPADETQRFVSIFGGKAVLRQEAKPASASLRTLRFYMRTGASPDPLEGLSRDDVLQTGCWHHIAATFDGTDQALYLDGQELARQSITGPGTTPDDGVFLSNSDDGVGWPPFTGPNATIEKLAGALDEVEFYNEALDGSAIGAKWNDGGSGRCGTSP